MVLSTTGFDVTVLRPWDTGLVFVAMLLGPSIAGLTMTGLLGGRTARCELRSRFLRWRFTPRWYAFALVIMPTVMLAVLWPFSLVVNPAYTPRFQWPLFAIGLVAATFEEIGWTGFATPRLRQRCRPFCAGLTLIADVLTVTDYLRDRFQQEKINLMSHSGGSFIGIQVLPVRRSAFTRTSVSRRFRIRSSPSAWRCGHSYLAS